jgi:putative ABC transport system permease protein
MSISSLSRLMREQTRVSMVAMSIDPARYTELRRALNDRPSVLGMTRREHQIELFKKQSTDQMKVFTWIVTIFASIIAVGVVYNNARVSLSMRSRDLASLRVLGFRRAEISAVLLGELAIQVLLGLPPGMVIGKWLAIGMMSTVDTEQYRFPVVISAQTYAYAAVVTLGAALISALLVRRKLDRLDLIGVLKTRE